MRTLARGALIGGLLIVSKAFGQVDTHSILLKANEFQAVSIDNASLTGLDLQPGFTIEAWIKLASEPASDPNVVGFGYYVIASKFAGSIGGNSYVFRYQNINEVYSLDLMLVTDNGTTATNLLMNHRLPIGEWHHVAVTYNTGGAAEFFLDGISLGSVGGGPSVMSVSSAGFVIGSFYPPTINNSSQQFFDGAIDEVRVWNLVRTASEIASNMNHEISASSSGLVGYWQFEHHNFDDSTMNHNDLTNYGATFSPQVPFRK